MRSARRLRSDARFDRTAILAQTGWGQDSDREKTRQAGFDVHLVKPISMDQLEAALAQAVARRAAR